MITFEAISFERQKEYLNLLSLSNISASDYSFINLWGWAEEYGLTWAWDGDLVWIRQSRPEQCLWSPIGLLDRIPWTALFNDPFLTSLPFSRVPEEVLNLWSAALPGRVEAQEDRGQWDYLYSVSELVELPGKRFHSKKNLLNQFKKKYSYSYRSIETPLIKSVLDMQEDWCAWRDCESVDLLASENRCISRVMAAWKELAGITGAAIHVDGRPVAFTVAERFKDDVILIHFEKGMHEYTGIYQAINQMFLEQNRHIPHVNREQDLGDEGLHRAKLSYNPTGYVRKYRVRIS